MWSGDTQSQGGSYPTQWALNPTAYVNIPSEQVDWATLAQQWIKMKEGLPQNEKEEGEAPMEITKDDNAPTVGAISSPTWPPNQPIDGVWPPNNWGWDQSGTWCWSGIGDPKLPPSAPFGSSYGTVPEPAAAAVVAAVAAPPIPPQPAFHFTPQSSSTNQHYTTNPGYWTGDPNSKDSWDSSSNRGSRKPPAIPEPLPELDSAKRKQLPAWIREGLEKMEREKQKKAESERLEKQRLEAMSRQREEEERQQQIVESNGSPAIPKKSKFETDSEDSGDDKETELVPNENSLDKNRKSRFDWKGPGALSPPKPVFRSKEEILQHVMAEVRKILTHLLMEVTTEEMQAIAEEVHGQIQKKGTRSIVWFYRLTSLQEWSMKWILFYSYITYFSSFLM